MTRTEACAALKRLVHGLPPDDAGVRRLLERIAATDDHELLRSLLVEVGALALLRDGGPQAPTRP